MQFQREITFDDWMKSNCSLTKSILRQEIHLENVFASIKLMRNASQSNQRKDLNYNFPPDSELVSEENFIMR